MSFKHYHFQGLCNSVLSQLGQRGGTVSEVLSALGPLPREFSAVLSSLGVTVWRRKAGKGPYPVVLLVPPWQFLLWEIGGNSCLQFLQWNDHSCFWHLYRAYDKKSLCSLDFSLPVCWFLYLSISFLCLSPYRGQRNEGCLPICVAAISSFFSFIFLWSFFLLQVSCFTLRYHQIYGLICLTSVKAYKMLSSP